MNPLYKQSLVIANPFWDKIYHVPDQFLSKNQLERGVSTPLSDPKEFYDIAKNAKSYRTEKTKGLCGGSGVNVMFPLSILGQTKCTLLGMIGMDKQGKKIEKQIDALGILSRLLKSEDKPTAKVLALITTDQERSMVAHLGATIEFNGNCINDMDLQGFDHIHLEGYAFFYPGVVSKCLQITSKNNIPVSLNLPTANIVKLFKKEILESLYQIGYLFGNKEEIISLKDQDNIEEALMNFPLEQTVAVTDGANQVIVKPKNSFNFVYSDVPKVDNIINKTGAGDIWAGIYLAFALQGKDPKTCIENANLGASLWISSKPGTYTNEKTWGVFKDVLIKEC